MSATPRILTWRALVWILPLSGAATAVGAAAGSALCSSAAGASSWFSVGGPFWGPFLTTAMSLTLGPHVRAQLPVLLLLSGNLATFVSISVVHSGLLALTLLASAVVAAATFYGLYQLRVVASLVCGAGVAALHAFGSLCPG